MYWQLRRMRLVYVSLLMVSLLLPALVPQMVQAQQFPNKPVIVVLGMPTGGTADFPARLLSSVAVDYLGQPMILQFKPGGSGTIANNYVMNSKPDGYTLLFGSTMNNSMIPAIEDKPGGPGDLVTVSRITYLPSLLIANIDAPFKTFKEMLAWAKTNPGKMTYGHTGVWGAADLFWRQVKKETGIVTRDVPHTGVGPIITALIGGHIMVSCINAAGAMPYIEAGKVRALAVMDSQRYPTLPNVPTGKEEGVDINSFMWLGILAPKATPRGIIDQLDVAIKKMAEDKFFVETLKKLGQDVGYMGPDEFDRFWRNEYEYYKELGKTFKK